MSGRRAFSAALSPGGVLVARYRYTGDELQVEQWVAERVALEDVDAALDRLADTVESMGGRGSNLALAMSGFGSSHHILSLPPAPPEVLRPVVEREMGRFYPDLKQPVLDFVLAGEVTDREGPKRDVLVGAIPRGVVERIHDALKDRGVALEHLTIMPRVVDHVFKAFDGSTRPSVMVVLAKTGPLIGCFRDGELRLFSEPPRLQPSGDAARGVVEHVERGALFLHQQFPFDREERVVMVAEAEAFEIMSTAIRAALDTEVTAADLAGSTPDAITALGAALDAASEYGLNLVPEPLRPAPATERWARSLGVAAFLVLAVAAVLWGWGAAGAARTVDQRLSVLNARLDREFVPVSEMRAVLEERRSHAERLAFLREGAQRQDRVQQMLRAVAASAPADIILDSLSVERDTDLGAWHLGVTGRATGVGSAAAVRAVDALYRGVPERLPVDEVVLDRLGSLLEDNASGSVAVDFEMSFIVRWEADLER